MRGSSWGCRPGGRGGCGSSTGSAAGSCGCSGCGRTATHRGGRVRPRSQGAAPFTVVEADPDRYVAVVVHYHRWTGPVYFTVIRPFHHLVARAGVRGGRPS
ncbi:DUF2867 domain-containing protein [Streptosporangium saharense]|uniref:DUF2867 domain-containing protein n=1 Tax=Streptosporangium saharense TaxID=1706840 RepID=UPI00342AB19B